MLKQRYTLPIILDFDSDQERESQGECKNQDCKYTATLRMVSQPSSDLSLTEVLSHKEHLCAKPDRSPHCKFTSEPHKPALVSNP